MGNQYETRMTEIDNKLTVFNILFVLLWVKLQFWSGRIEKTIVNSDKI